MGGAGSGGEGSARDDVVITGLQAGEAKPAVGGGGCRGQDAIDAVGVGLF